MFNRLGRSFWYSVDAFLCGCLVYPVFDCWRVVFLEDDFLCLHSSRSDLCPGLSFILLFIFNGYQAWHWRSRIRVVKDKIDRVFFFLGKDFVFVLVKYVWESS